MTVSNTFNEALWASRSQKKNYILNGAMMVSQENGTTAGTTSGYYPVDQWSCFYSFAGAVNLAQVASATPSGSPNRLRVTVTTPDASVAAGDYIHIYQQLEGLRVADLGAGLSTAKTVTLRFGVRAPAGTYCINVRGGSPTRSYVAEYTISAGEANTDVVRTVTFALDPSSPSTYATNNTGAWIVSWTLMGGSTYTGSTGWSTGTFINTVNQSNFMATNSNVFELFDVGLYQGNVDPGFYVPDYTSELLLCQRYFEKATFSGIFTAGGSFSTIYAPFYFVEKRGSVTVGLPSTTNICWTSAGAPTTPSSLTMGVSSVKSGYIRADGSGLGGIQPFNLTLNVRM